SAGTRWPPAYPLGQDTPAIRDQRDPRVTASARRQTARPATLARGATTAKTIGAAPNSCMGGSDFDPNLNCAEGGGRTHTPLARNRLLRPARLPIPPLRPLPLVQLLWPNSPSDAVLAALGRRRLGRCVRHPQSIISPRFAQGAGRIRVSVTVLRGV